FVRGVVQEAGRKRDGCRAKHEPTNPRRTQSSQHYAHPLRTPHHLCGSIRTARLAELYGSSTAFLTVPQPFVIYGRKSSYIGCRPPISRPSQCCVNTHARRIIGEIWRLPSADIFP